MSRKIIITADDYGLCPEVNQAIEECLAIGTVTSTNVMMNMISDQDVVDLRVRFPKASIGIHWTVTQGQPALPRTQVASLVNDRGFFYPLDEFKHRLILGKIKLNEIQAELQAQFRKMCLLGYQPVYWNTHQNIHLWPGLYQMCVQLGNQLKIPAMRSHRRIWVVSGAHGPDFLSRLKGQLLAYWASMAKSKGTHMPDGLIEIQGFPQGKAQLEDVLMLLDQRFSNQILEYVIHPATGINKEYFTRLTSSRLAEYNVFRDGNLQKRLSSRNIEIVGFDVLG